VQLLASSSMTMQYLLIAMPIVSELSSKDAAIGLSAIACGDTRYAVKPADLLSTSEEI